MSEKIGDLCKPGFCVIAIDGSSCGDGQIFNPRRDEWARHFAFRNYWIAGLTPAGRATVHVLGMNETRRLELLRDATCPRRDAVMISGWVSRS